MRLPKIILFFAFLQLFIFCSSNEESSENQSQFGYFNINYNNSPLVFDNWSATKDGDYYRISASKYQSTGANSSQLTNDFSMLLHKDGTLLNTSMYDINILGYYKTPFNSNSKFNFNIETIDDLNRTLKLNFNGQLFENSYYDTGSSTFKEVLGSIYVQYEDLNPNSSSIANYGTTCQINNQNWRGLGRYEDVSQHFIQIYGDDQHLIELVLPKDNLELGTYNYSGDAAAFRDYSVQYLKFNQGQNNIPDEEFVTTGTITLNEIGLGYFKGTFSFTSHNPNTNENVVVTNGIFSEKSY